jgi:hypothetical protein
VERECFYCYWSRILIYTQNVEECEKLVARNVRAAAFANLE